MAGCGCADRIDGTSVVAKAVLLPADVQAFVAGLIVDEGAVVQLRIDFAQMYGATAIAPVAFKDSIQQLERAIDLAQGPTFAAPRAAVGEGHVLEARSRASLHEDSATVVALLVVILEVAPGAAVLEPHIANHRV
ncbi:hypothetical protein KDL67_07055 [bacterium]|nr:hypothetical protein [bacterium]